ncbi:MAG TPA: Gfo/Idh/MocA family oxidoreductase [Isosphaeraceae bacterium]|nr:Gfo/Idh/MocA family oxidoreductase [Isosphaeraceae bacterium]
MTEKKSVSRRGFLQTTGAVAAAGTFAHPAIGDVRGANERINFAILGPGGRAQEHIGILLGRKDQKKDVDLVAVCDVWDGGPTKYSADGKGHEARGLYPSAKRAGLDVNDKQHVTKDYRRVLDLKDVDAVVIATPDHWHAKMTIDACEAKKDVYCEKPMTHTIDEARRVVEAVKKNERVMTVGVQSTADPRWRMANDLITAGKIGKVMQAQTSYYRNSTVGQWRYYGLTEDMNPKTIDWKMFLGTDFGLAPEQPFDRARYAQWRCYWDFGGGMYTDLFVHQLTHLIQATGVRFPRRVVGAGGLYMEYDGRDVPDVATVVADYDEGCQVIISATMCNEIQLGEVIRGHTGTIRFHGDNREGFNLIPEKISGRPAPPGANTGEGGERYKPEQPKDDTAALWEHFLGCLRSRNPATLCPPELGYAAITTVNLGVDSYRKGKAYFFDKDSGKISEADESWAKKWEARSHKREKPVHVMGWKAGDEGSLLEPPSYQKLEGEWVDGKDPAKKA